MIDVEDLVACPNCEDWYWKGLETCPKCDKATILAKAPKTPQKAAKEAISSPKGTSKQASKKVHHNGFIFDSEKEYRRYTMLLGLQLIDEIRHLEVHPKFELLAKVPKYKQGAISYTADFSYFYEGVCVIEDVKATYGNSAKNQAKGIAGKPIITEVARLRHKLLIALLYIKYGDNFEFKIVTDVEAF